MTDRSTFLRDLQKAFSSWPRPAIFSQSNAREAGQIESELSGVDRDQMPYNQAANLIVDSALISDDALCYFLPRTARAALTEGGDAFMLLQRLERLDLGALNAHQRSLLDLITGLLKERVDLLSQEEQEELERGRREWRRRLLDSGKAEDLLLLAIADGNMAEVERLIDLGADVNAKDYNGNTALSIAKMYGRDDIIAILDPNLRK